MAAAPGTASHYRRLGVTPAASTAEIRDAYRSLAGRFHPDRLAGSGDAERALAERRMREINEAWRVLGDPDRRRAYDRERWGGGTAAASPPGPSAASVPVATSPPDLVDVVGPLSVGGARAVRHLPWLVLVAVLGGIFVVTAYASRDPEPDAPVRSGNEVGTCLDVDPGPVTTVVPCDGPHEFRIASRSSTAEGCPVGTDARRLAPDGRFDCLVPT